MTLIRYKSIVIIASSLVLNLLFPINLSSQISDTVLNNPTLSSKQPVEIDFMSSYYNQDGEHSAVTGGEGTEALKDYANIIKINIPLKKNKQLLFNNRISYFTSASTDNIDPLTISGASRNDIHVEVNATVIKKVEGKRDYSYNISIGAANEAHFASMNAGFGFSKSIDKWQAEIGVNTHFIMDAWGPYYNLSKLYPSDYFGFNPNQNNKRYTWQNSLYYKQIINEKLQASISLDVIQQFGLLSTPYNRIYFSDKSEIDIERLPSYKLRLPISTRLNYFAANWLVLRSSYRFYWDNYELKAHTFSLEAPFKIHRFFNLYPFYRFHIQYGNEYFKTKGNHLSSEEFYTSDYDVSNLQSHTVGGGFKWMPFKKLKRKKDVRLSMKSVEMRTAYYQRNDGFKSWLISGGLSFAILRKDSKKTKVIKREMGI